MEEKKEEEKEEEEEEDFKTFCFFKTNMVYK
jgi:hypothetical protein